MIYFTADTHFGHENILKFCDRPLESVEAMNGALIAKWNRRVTGQDTVYILGDHNSSWTGKVELSKYFLSIDTMLEISDGQHGSSSATIRF